MCDCVCLCVSVCVCVCVRPRRRVFVPKCKWNNNNNNWKEFKFAFCANRKSESQPPSPLPLPCRGHVYGEASLKRSSSVQLSSVLAQFASSSFFRGASLEFEICITFLSPFKCKLWLKGETPWAAARTGAAGAGAGVGAEDTLAVYGSATTSDRNWIF